MNELHLFAGCGGGVLGSKLLGHRVIGYVEREPYRCRVLAQRIKDGILDDAPIYCGTVRDFIDLGYAAAYSGLVDVLCAGFPCPPFSLAGKRLGGADPRNGWPETIDAIRIIKPRFAFLENVPGLVTSPYLETISGDLQEAGYRICATIISGFDVGSWQIRKRLWLLACPPPNMANSNEKRLEKRVTQDAIGARQDCGSDIGRGVNEEDIPNPEGIERGAGLRQDGPKRNRFEFADCNGNGKRWWDAEPRLDRMADGVADRVERIEAIGDGQIPRVVEAAWKTLTQDL